MNIQNPKIPLVGYVIGSVVGSAVVFSGLLLMTRLLREGPIPAASAVGALVVLAALVAFRRTFSPYLTEPGKQVKELETGGDSSGEPPSTPDDRLRIDRADAIAVIDRIGEPVFYRGANQIRVTTLKNAQELVPKYEHRPSGDTTADKETGVEYRTVQGAFTSEGVVLPNPPPSDVDLLSGSVAGGTIDIPRTG